MPQTALTRVAGPLAQLASALASATTVDDVMASYLAHVRSVMPSRAVGIYLSRGAGKPPRALADGVSDYYLELYEELGRQIDPVLQAVMDSGEARSSSQTMGVDEWHASEFYQKVLSVHGFQSTLKAPILANGRIVGTLNFGDREPDAFDHPGDHEIATALGHIVGLAVGLATQIEDVDRERLLFRQAFESSDDALVIADLRTGARLPNPAARRILDLLSPDDAELLLEDLLALNAPRRPSDGIPATVQGDTCQVSVQPLNLGPERKLLIARLTVRGGDTAEAQVTTFAQALLSPRERQIAAAVSLGLHDQQIADNLVLSVHTDKQHLKSIYKKLGVNSRVELTRLVLMRRAPEGDPTATDDLGVDEPEASAGGHMSSCGARPDSDARGCGGHHHDLGT